MPILSRRAAASAHSAPYNDARAAAPLVPNPFAGERTWLLEPPPPLARQLRPGILPRCWWHDRSASKPCGSPGRMDQRSPLLSMTDPDSPLKRRPRTRPNNRPKPASGLQHHLDTLVFHDDSVEHLAYEIPPLAEGQTAPVGAESAYHLLPLAAPLRLGRLDFRPAMGLD
jgi:hypothetical protein